MTRPLSIPADKGKMHVHAAVLNVKSRPEHTCLIWKIFDETTVKPFTNALTSRGVYTWPDLHGHNKFSTRQGFWEI